MVRQCCRQVLPQLVGSVASSGPLGATRYVAFASITQARTALASLTRLSDHPVRSYGVCVCGQDDVDVVTCPRRSVMYSVDSGISILSLRQRAAPHSLTPGKVQRKLFAYYHFGFITDNFLTTPPLLLKNCYDVYND